MASMIDEIDYKSQQNLPEKINFRPYIDRAVQTFENAGAYYSDAIYDLMEKYNVPNEIYASKNENGETVFETFPEVYHKAKMTIGSDMTQEEFLDEIALASVSFATAKKGYRSSFRAGDITADFDDPYAEYTGPVTQGMKSLIEGFHDPRDRSRKSIRDLGLDFNYEERNEDVSLSYSGRKNENGYSIDRNMDSIESLEDHGLFERVGNYIKDKMNGDSPEKDRPRKSMSLNRRY